MNIRALRTMEDYEAALSRIDALMDAAEGTPEGDELDVLATLVSAYEKAYFPITAPDPIAFIRHAMEFKGFTQNDLAKLLNSRSRASELLHKRRPLTLEHIRKITTTWNIPAQPLLQEYELAGKEHARA